MLLTPCRAGENKHGNAWEGPKARCTTPRSCRCRRRSPFAAIPPASYHLDLDVPGSGAGDIRSKARSNGPEGLLVTARETATLGPSAAPVSNGRATQAAVSAVAQAN